MDIRAIIKKLVGPIKWLYSRLKPATLEYVRREVKIRENRLEYTFTYRFKKPKWSLWLSKKDVSIPVGNEVEVISPEILLPAGLGTKGIKVRELRASVREILTPHWTNMKDSEEIQITVINPFDGTEFIKRDIQTAPEQKQKTILFQNILPYPVEQHEVSLLISEPHAIRDIRIEKKGENIGVNRCVTVETQSIETLTGSEIPEKFPSGISAATAIGSKRADRSALMKIRLDFEPSEQIKVIMMY